MKKYFKYFMYVIEHKYNIYRAYRILKKNKTIRKAMGVKTFIHVIFHDMSKFLPSEFIPYARYFYGDYPSSEEIGNKIDLYSGKTKEEVKEEFDEAWKLHYSRNPHHWEYWHDQQLCMPVEYLIYEVIDWTAMSLKFGGTPQEYYIENMYKEEIYHDEMSKKWLEEILFARYLSRGDKNDSNNYPFNYSKILSYYMIWFDTRFDNKKILNKLFKEYK